VGRERTSQDRRGGASRLRRPGTPPEKSGGFPHPVDNFEAFVDNFIHMWISLWITFDEGKNKYIGKKFYTEGSQNVSSECENVVMNNSNIPVVATEENYLEILNSMSPLLALAYARNIASRLSELRYYPDGDDCYWMEKPHKFPEFWVHAINGTLDDTEFEEEEE